MTLLVVHPVVVINALKQIALEIRLFLCVFTCFIGRKKAMKPNDQLHGELCEEVEHDRLFGLGGAVLLDRPTDTDNRDKSADDFGDLFGGSDTFGDEETASGGEDVADE